MIARFNALFIAVCTLLITVPAIANESLLLGNFSEGDLTGWEEKSFKGNSLYSFIEADIGRVLRASTEGQASGLFKEVSVDLTKTPWINWSWKIENTFKNNNERSKEGDDYAVRVYVVISGGIFFWNTKALNYVWASHELKDSSWPNAYTGNAKMIAIQSGDIKLNQWLKEKRNVREDFKALFGEDITNIDVIAVMVDGDNTGQSATSYFGDIFFSEN